MPGLDHERYCRTLDELHEHASLFWPRAIAKEQTELSLIPILLETQEQFVDILSVQVLTFRDLFRIIDSSALTANLFVKHLMVLSDVGAERLQKFNNEFSRLFPDRRLVFLQNGSEISYQFKALPTQSKLTNDRLRVTATRLQDNKTLTDLHKDVVMLLLFGAMAIDEDTADTLAKCTVGQMLGDRQRLGEFVRQRYIWVSRITAGAESNTLGNIAQLTVTQYLQTRLPKFDFSRRC